MSVHILCSYKYIPYEFVCVYVSVGLALQAGRTGSSFLFSNMGMADVGLSTVPSAGALPLACCSSVLSLAKVLCCPVFGGERGGLEAVERH